MRTAKVFYKGKFAGTLTQNNEGGFHFKYDEQWLIDDAKPSISLTMPKRKMEFWSKYLFPFFYHLLPEGVNKKMVCKALKIDEEDEFGILLHIAQYDTIGAVTLQSI